LCGAARIILHCKVQKFAFDDAYSASWARRAQRRTRRETTVSIASSIFTLPAHARTGGQEFRGMIGSAKVTAALMLEDM
jgi:hypothetical protein